MAVIDVRAPDGSVVKVRIAGDTPTEQERKTIAQGLVRMSETGSPSQAPVRYAGNAGLDVASATPEEVEEYVRLRKQAGFKPTGERMTSEEYAGVYREEGVDYTQGLQDTGNFSRFGFGRMETDEGRANYLRRSVGEGGFRQDALGRFVLTQQGRKNLGMGAGPDLAIDEEGLSFGDLKEFLGQSGMPLAAGIGAGLIASGVGIVPGVLISAAAAGGAKLLDEGIEYAQGLQDQTFNDVMRDAAVEAAFSGAGEVAGRAISAGLGRLLKGPAGRLAEAERANIIAALDAGAQPTLAGVTSQDFRPALKLIQGFSEAVFPNAAAARTNLNVVLDQIKDLRVIDQARLDDLGDALRRDVDLRFATSREKLMNVEKYADDVLNKDLNKAAASLRKDGVVPQELFDVLRLRKTVFDQNYDSLVNDPMNALNGQKFIFTGGVKEALSRIIKDSPAALSGTNFAKQINELGDYVEYKDISTIRTAVREVMQNPRIANDVSAGSLVGLKDSLTEALEDAERFVFKASRAPVGILEDKGRIVNMDGVTAQFSDLGEALDFMRRANSLYRDVMRRFDNLTTLGITKAAQTGRINENYVLTDILKPNNPEILDQVLKAVRGTKFVEGLEPGSRTARRQLIGGMTLAEAKEELARIPQGAPDRRLLAQQIRRVEEERASVSAANRTGAEEAERVRRSFATMYLDSVIKDSTVTSGKTGLQVIDPVKFVTNFEKIGSTNKVLFKKEMKDIDSLLSVMRTSKAELAPSVLEDAIQRNPTLTAALTDVKKFTREQDALEKSGFFRVLQEGDPEEVAKQVLKSKKNTAEALKALDPDTMEAVRDAAMLRILRQVDIVPARDGKVIPSDDLMKGFESGRLGERFLTVLNSYDKETLEALFGPGTSSGLRQLAQSMSQFSNAAIKGKGSIMAAGVGATMAGFGFLFSPLAVLAPLAKYYVMSKALRDPRILRMLSRSRDTNSVRQLMQGKLSTKDPLAQGFKVINQLVAQASVQGGRGFGEQGEQETQPAQALAQRRAQETMQTEGVNQMLSDLGQVGQQAMQTVTSPIQALTQTPQSPSSAAASRVNPILVPNPATRAALGE
jgi:hypothetical protein